MTNPVDKLRAQSEAAAPGPYTISSRAARVGGDNYLVCLSSERWVFMVMEGPKSEEDAQFLAASANLVRRMLSDAGVRSVSKALDEAGAVVPLLTRSPDADFYDQLARAAIAALVRGDGHE